MKYYLLPVILLFSTLTFAQKHDGPTPITPAIEKKINAEIEKEIPVFLVKLEKETQERTDKFDESVKFCTDTFKIERFLNKAMDYDYSTTGMNKIVYDAAAKYDVLMNKYYKLLSAKLKPKDKAVLLTAQRSWLAYRDNELKLYGMLTQDEYSGGGTIQSNFRSSHYMELIKERALKLWKYYAGLYN
ncbi:DUF1311 domain-containing protein [Mucilaginibacter sp. HMF5004]|uniref:lysozyme inhibitor LprI family protein n=1 Tax=Mucilaginibacter rivuli TaxID=2857527 RepID=UPI001C5E57C2|nr:lysozyme inhibitor LprI family protein [Mucilaginibacter rivuli]MBW4889707.1 DUF1311 domain-containing protein [Mucilaginibacter rivuli]